MEAAHGKKNAAEEAQLDADFHMSIFEASHNVVMLHMMRSMYQLLREGVFYNRNIMFKQQTKRAVLLGQHRAINAGLQARNPQAARKAVEVHLDFVESSLRDGVRTTGQEVIAKQRLDSVIDSMN